MVKFLYEPDAPLRGGRISPIEKDTYQTSFRTAIAVGPLENQPLVLPGIEAGELAGSRRRGVSRAARVHQ